MQLTASEAQRQSNGVTTSTRYGKLRVRALADLDGRTAAARRVRELAAGYASDLGGDLTTAQEAIIDRIVSLQIWCECNEAQYAETGELCIGEFTTATNSLRRLLADIGLDRRSHDVTASLPQFIENLQREKARQTPADASAASEGGQGSGQAPNQIHDAPQGNAGLSQQEHRA